eukprot:1055505-Rhodomonas_salina.1
MAGKPVVRPLIAWYQNGPVSTQEHIQRSICKSMIRSLVPNILYWHNFECEAIAGLPEKKGGRGEGDVRLVG